MKVIRSIRRMQKSALEIKKQGKRISFVPTMGALHEGHLQLVRRARKLAEITIVSVFVNPTQFAPGEDLERYPRDLTGDQQLLDKLGVDIMFIPKHEDIYPPGFDTWVVPGDIATILEGKMRPTHFRGVATIVMKLFNIVIPDVAVFGRKDLQQSIVIKNMVRDLNLPVKIVVVPTVRDRDQLALSSRNAYLTHAGREQARVIPELLFKARREIISGERSAARIRNWIKRLLIEKAKAEVDYVSVADRNSLKELSVIHGDVAISLACCIDDVRLIDNVTLKVD